MKEIIKNTIILFCITLAVGVLLALVYEVTKDPIAEQEEIAKQKAYAAVFNDDESITFKQIDFDADAVTAAIDSADDAYGVGSDIANVVEIAEATDSSGSLIGYVIEIDSYKGYGGTIEFTVGIQIEGTVNGYSILSIDETAGLGQHAKDEDFKAQFNGKNVEYFTYTKSGSTSESEIDAISGATITTKAMTYGMNTAIVVFNYLTGGEQ